MERSVDGTASRGCRASARPRYLPALLAVALVTATALLVAPGKALSQARDEGPKFYPDDPIWKEPPPFPAFSPERRELSGILEYFSNTFIGRGERHPRPRVIPAGGVNTIGGVPDSGWFTNRHARHRLTLEELMRGPGDDLPPAIGAPWRILTVKTHGARPGILIADSEDQLYLLRFDPPPYLELSTGAQMVTSRFFYALGYNVLEEYVVYFRRENLVIEAGAEEITSYGGSRELLEEHVDWFLRRVAQDPQRGYRAVATRVPEGNILGPYQLFTTRSDDPNDIVPHEHRRDLRGLHVLSSWLGHDEFRAVNTLEVQVEEDGVPFIKRYVVDFFATLGSGQEGPKAARAGNERLWDRRTALINVAGMGFHSPAWQRETYPGIRSVGRFGCSAFDPLRWVSAEELPPFENRLPDDDYWAAKLVMSFSDEEIRSIALTGQYSDPRAAEWIADCLIVRRDKIGRAHFARVLPLEDFEIVHGELTFVDLEIENGFVADRDYEVEWFRYNNETDEHAVLLSAGVGPEVPPLLLSVEDGGYFGARLFATGDDPEKATAVYFRREADTFKVVGIDRGWPEKMIADPTREVDTGRSRYVDLDAQQKALFDPHAEEYNQRSGRSYTPEEYFDSLTISERTTFDAVTHALQSSTLTDEEGNSLGTALDLIARIERIAGQYYGRGGDQQFRLYVDLEPDADDILQRAVEFRPGHENTVYHVGYPHSYRQEGNVPNIQFSVSEGGLRADIDVDYRSSKFPQAMWNGHLTAANSDVRQGDNHRRHTARWSGLIDWWRGVFGGVFDREAESNDLMWKVPPEPPTPLPPDRPRGASIPEFHDAVQEFLTDWLVREQYDDAMDSFSDEAMECVYFHEDYGGRSRDIRTARRFLRDLLEEVVDEIGPFDNLTEAIDPVLPWRPETLVHEHPFDGEFAVVEGTNAVGVTTRCRYQAPGAPPVPEVENPDAYGTYFGILFSPKVAGGEAGALGIIWVRENGEWRIISWLAYGA